MSERTEPEPDDKDWTWVLERPCPDCDFDAVSVERARVPELVRSYTAQLAAALDHPESTTRPAPTVWSAMEYACHVRDVCRTMAVRARLMLTEHDPSFPNWDQDSTALEQGYRSQQVDIVRPELVDAADDAADMFHGLDAASWQRPGRRSNGSVFTVDTLARYFLHDLAHHVWDVRWVHA